MRSPICSVNRHKPDVVRVFLMLSCWGVLWLLAGSAASAQPRRPNILWITAEDMSPTLGCYGDAYANTPNVDALAKRSVLFTNAFATSPVCSPTRACIINGMIATTQGAHSMRARPPLPSFLRGFPALLRDAGYFTSNNSKTDYNSANEPTIIAASWTQNGPAAHWRHRKPNQPFFSVFNLMVSHQSRTMVWPREQFEREVQSRLRASQIHDPAKAPLPPYYPDTSVVRRTVARYYDCVTLMDLQVGELLRELDEEGLTDSTIIFFYSDHGSGMPRHKRVLLDSGMKTPLLVHFPDAWRLNSPSGSLARAPGLRADRLVSFEDLAPTVLQLTGVAIPSWVSGQDFLGASERAYVYGHRDRVDEARDLSRSVRTKRFLYLRNYMPHLSYNQPSAWVDQGPLQHEFYTLANRVGLPDAQQAYVAPRRPVEELYDCQDDPWNTQNLAGDARFADVLRKLRAEHARYVRRSLDLGFVPEFELEQIARREPAYFWARKNASRLHRIQDAADQAGIAEEDRLIALLASDDPAVRYWGAIGMHVRTKIAEPARSALHDALDDRRIPVRIEAASALAAHRQSETALNALLPLLEGDDTTLLLHAARAVELLEGDTRRAEKAMRALFQRFEDLEGDPAWFIRFTTSGFLSRL